MIMIYASALLSVMACGVLLTALTNPADRWLSFGIYLVGSMSGVLLWKILAAAGVM